MRRIIQASTFLIAALMFQSYGTHQSVSDTTVYICVTGKVYHSTRSCRGLNNAKSKIKAIPLSEAKRTRRPCKICY